MINVYEHTDNQNTVQSQSEIPEQEVCLANKFICESWNLFTFPKDNF